MVFTVIPWACSIAHQISNKPLAAKQTQILYYIRYSILDMHQAERKWIKRKAKENSKRTVNEKSKEKSQPGGSLYFGLNSQQPARMADGWPQRIYWYVHNTSTWGPRHQSPCIPCMYERFIFEYEIDELLAYLSGMTRHDYFQLVRVHSLAYLPICQ